jgi:hypothetical protein
MLKTAFLIGFLFLVIAFSGCIEKQIEIRYIQVTPEATPNPVSIYRSIADDSGNIPAVQNINGVNRVMDVSGKIIRINGQYNEITILNKDVSEIWVNGQFNKIFYPKEASPLIKDNGDENEIKTY